eukprot:CAMPEP_0173192064 /NCGR_PEP_ID=MMETSP1141-20130122/13223_1 /TAXON_ID=483371 /ORGANISM="non described non described, Strain CCMP2298" /LENGTH=65 /DNA_ID=CAMNT_0014116303 /DNA_START=221 /DNA_END=418 /DNA_ORIENTATION=+
MVLSKRHVFRLAHCAVFLREVGLIHAELYHAALLRMIPDVVQPPGDRVERLPIRDVEDHYDPLRL